MSGAASEPGLTQRDNIVAFSPNEARFYLYFLVECLLKRSFKKAKTNKMKSKNYL